MAVAVADHLEEIAVFESVERLDDCRLPAGTICRHACRRDRQCAVAAAYRRFPPEPGALQQRGIQPRPYLIKGQRAVLVELVAGNRRSRSGS